MKHLLYLVILLYIQQAHGQTTVTDENKLKGTNSKLDDGVREQPGSSLHKNFTGNWIGVKDHRGLLVSSNGLNKLFSCGNDWCVSEMNSDFILYLDTVLHSTDKVFEVWGMKTEILRAQLTDGTEKRMEIPKYAVYRLSLVNAETLELSKSQDYGPHTDLEGRGSLITKEMKMKFMANKALYNVGTYKKLTQ